MVEAERAWATGDLWGAASAFDRAIRDVQQRQRPWHHALVAERAALFHLSQGNEYAGRALLVDARRSYQSWGATGKVDELDRAHQLPRSSDGPWRESGGPHGTPTVSADSIDLLAVVEASRALSSETNLDRLRDRVVEVLTAMTGATSVQVLLYDSDRHEWFLPPADGAGRASVSADEAGTLGLIPLSVFRYAERTRAPLLVADATDDDRFARDPYVAGLGRCSLLVVPILTQGESQAMLILENRLSSGTFTADRLDAVTLIAGQLAVSLNNALVYQSLEQKVAKRTEALAAANQRLQQLSITDTLTGLANRRCLEERSEAAWQLALQSQSHLAAAMIDIDHFKLYNDHYGHVAGDECLRRVAHALRRSIRGTDLVARYGGEEFVVILPDTDTDGAYHVAERARAAVAALGEPHARAAGGLVSVSVGIAAILPVGGATVEQLFKSADAQLYRAKQDGRNRVYGCGVPKRCHDG
jgi:diguanylate cyclase (GGDEF)-like protein